MARKKAEVIDLNPKIVPDRAGTKLVYFYEPLRLRPRGLPAFTIETGTIAESFYYQGKRHFYFPGLKYLIKNISFSGTVVLEDHVEFKTEVETSLIGKTVTGYTLRQRKQWKRKFKGVTDPAVTEMAKVLFMIQNCRMENISPPTLEPHFKALLSFCERTEQYEQCGFLMDWLDKYRFIHRGEKQKNPLFAFTQGVSWLFSKTRIVPEPC